LEDVVSQPGFLWARMIFLEETSEDGWSSYMMMYGVESREALEVYFNSDASARYAKERADLGLDDLVRVERHIGDPGPLLTSG
jgi:hypothetical protein